MALYGGLSSEDHTPSFPPTGDIQGMLRVLNGGLVGTRVDQCKPCQQRKTSDVLTGPCPFPLPNYRGAGQRVYCRRLMSWVD